MNINVFVCFRLYACVYIYRYWHIFDTYVSNCMDIYLSVHACTYILDIYIYTYTYS